MDDKIVEWVERIAVLKLPIKEFYTLSLNDKLIAYHLWHASAIGDAINYDQRYKHGLQLRNLMLEIVKHRDKISEELYSKTALYTNKLVLHHGNHYRDSSRKFIPGFTEQELGKTVKELRNSGVKLDYSKHLGKVIFDPAFEEMLTNKNPGEGKDMLEVSHNNMYENVTLKDLENYDDEFHFNSKIVKEKGKIKEMVFRAGNPLKNIPPGLYSEYLSKISSHLESASKYAESPQAKYLQLLKQYFEEGHHSIFVDYNINWVKTDSKVDKILGFIEEYIDVRKMKGEFEGLVMIRDEETSKITRGIAELAQYLEDKAPWKQEYKKKWTRVPVANAIELLVATGQGGPITWAGVNLPNSQDDVRENHGSKNNVLANVVNMRNSFFPVNIKEFVEDKDDRERLLKHQERQRFATISLHEVVGHGSGKVSSKLGKNPDKILREYYSTLEEARADLCALHHIWDDKLRKTGIIPNEDCCKASYTAYIVRYLTVLDSESEETELHEDHHRGTHMIINYIMDKTNAIKRYEKDGKTYFKIADYNAMRKAVSDLLSELMRIKAEGDYPAIKELVQKYGIKIDVKLKKEVIERSKRLNIPEAYAFLMPEPKLVKDNSGNIKDVILEYPGSLIEQAERWKELER